MCVGQKLVFVFLLPCQGCKVPRVFHLHDGKSSKKLNADPQRTYLCGTCALKLVYQGTSTANQPLCQDAGSVCHVTSICNCSRLDRRPLRKLGSCLFFQVVFVTSHQEGQSGHPPERWTLVPCTRLWLVASNFSASHVLSGAFIVCIFARLPV